MTRSKESMIPAIATVAVLVLSIAGLQLWLWRSPLASLEFPDEYVLKLGK